MQMDISRIIREPKVKKQFTNVLNNITFFKYVFLISVDLNVWMQMKYVISTWYLQEVEIVIHNGMIHEVIFHYGSCKIGSEKELC